MAKQGRPTDYKPEFDAEAQQMALEGATDQEMADYFGVDVRSLNRWKNTQPSFRQSIKAGKDVTDDRVERSLYERALGYERDEVDIKVIAGEIVKTPIRKFYPPDTTAAIFWLKNRKSQEWRDIKAVELSGKDGGPMQANVTVEFVKRDDSAAT